MIVDLSLLYQLLNKMVQMMDDNLESQVEDELYQHYESKACPPSMEQAWNFRFLQPWNERY